MKKDLDIFYFSATHWDREWYQTFQAFRYRLVRLVDNLIDLFDKDPDFKTFHFDGQTIVLEDYTEISPEKKDALKKLIKERKVLIGPWYVMPDEFLVSGESLIKNLAIGHKICKEWETEPWKYGYICDVFGHIAQMPQLFNGFDIKYSCLGRGTTETDPNYFRWQSPDGSETINYNLDPDSGYGSFPLFVYSDQEDQTIDNPVIVERIKKFVEKETERSEYPVIIMMDGVDHFEAAPNASAYIKKIAELFPNANVHFVDLCKQGELMEQYKDSMPVIKGELNKTASTGHGFLHLISNTLSSYYTLKAYNDKCQNLLEKELEPYLVMGELENKELNRSFINLAHKYLIQNHPHDSICGCSIDQVHKDMEYRYDQIKQLCETVRFDYLVRDGKNHDDADNYDHILTLYNPLPFDRNEVMTIEIPFPKDYTARYSEPFGYEAINAFLILDNEGNEVPYNIAAIKKNTAKRVFNNTAKQFDCHIVTFMANIPSMGKASYRIVPVGHPVRYLNKLKSGADFAENNHIRMNILSDGSIKIFDKKTQRTYTDLLNLIDDGEIGDGWYHANPVEDRVVSSRGGKCLIEKVENGVSRCVFRVTRNMTVPAEMVYDDRGIRRSENTVDLKVVSYIGLSDNNRHVDVKMYVDNNSKDHRLRLAIPSGIDGDTYFSGQAFCYNERKTGINMETMNWRETDCYEKSTNGIVGKRTKKGDGISFVSPFGIHECACFDDENSTLTVTLLRGVRKTIQTNGEERCQINGTLEYSFAIAPIDKDVTYSDLVKLQDLMACSVQTNFKKVSKETKTDLSLSYINVSGKNINTSIVKLSESGDGSVVIRIFNPSNEDSEATISSSLGIFEPSLVNLNEEWQEDLKAEGDTLKLKVAPFKIVTVSFKTGKTDMVPRELPVNARGIVQ